MKKYLVAVFVFALLFSACSSLVQKSGEFLEGKTFAEKTVTLFQTEGGRNDRTFEIREQRLENGESVLEIKDSFVPGLVLRGKLPETGLGPDGVFDLTEAGFLATHSQGWNEFTLELIGSARLQKSGDGVVLYLPGQAERVQISSGRLRLKASRIGGADALRNLRNRRERILAVIDWMQERQGFHVFESQKEFEDYWKPLLLPEMAPAAKRPDGYSEENANWNRADEVRWNVNYTESLFPEWLWELRNSGALLRDWEEASSWFFLEYQWDSIVSAFDGIALKKIKGD